MSHRVVITGMGALTPLGSTVDSFWENLRNGVVGFDIIKSIDTSDLKIKIAGELKGFVAENYFDKREINRMDKFTQYGVAAAIDAVANSDLDVKSVNPERFGVIVGSGIGGLGTIEEQVSKMNSNGTRRVSPLFIPMTIVNMVAGTIAIKFGAQGICTSVVTACATGTNCIGEAYRNIKDGYLDVCLTGGCEAPITKIGMSGFSAIKTLSASNDIHRASIPFDAERNGFVMGEGAGILVLESLDHALERGAHILCEIVGYGTTCDAYHITLPCDDGYGAAQAINMAINDAGIEAKQIDYINAHGTSTIPNDRSETLAIKKVFGDFSYEIPISSTKSMTGHLLGAAGAIELIATVKSINESFIHPTAGLCKFDPDCDLNYVPNTGIDCDIEYAISNSFGFGGHNAVICVKKWS